MATTALSYRIKRTSSDSDSDDSDEECRDWKRATKRTERIAERIQIETPPAETPLNPSPEDKPTTTKRKRNNIWSDVLEDQILSESLNHCGVKQKPKGYGSRGSESYDYTLAQKYYKKDENSEDRMSEEEMLSDSTEASSVTSFKQKKFPSNKYVKLNGPEKDIARKIVKTLAEQKQYLIFRIVKYLGIEKAMKLLKMTEEIEENGGMMIKNNARRRTPGGVYFQLLRTDKEIPQSSLDKIFEGEMNSFEIKRKLDQKRKQNKMKKAAEKAALKAKELPLPISFPQQKVKLEAIKMEDDSALMEVQLPITNDIPLDIKSSKDSDLEDGEIDD